MKTIKLTLETAKELYKEGGAGKQFALDNYTENELTSLGLVKSWDDLRNMSGYYIDDLSNIYFDKNFGPAQQNKSVFATESQAKSALAMAQLSQLMKQANGDWIPDWTNPQQNKYSINRFDNTLNISFYQRIYKFLVFKTYEIAIEFLELHKDLIEQYYEIQTY